MTRTRTTRLRRPLLAGTTAVAAMAVTASLVAATAEPAKAATGPELSLIAATDSLTLTSWKEDPGVYLDLGTYLTADGRPLELKVTRKSYKDPVTITQTVYAGGKARAKTLPKGTVKDFSGLPGFAEITVTDKAGRKVLSRTEDFCPNNASGRVRPDAPATSKYPESCPTNPFTLGSVWGVEKGWAANTYGGSYTEPVALAAGTYTAKVGVAKKYRDLFGIANKPATVKVTVVERSYEDDQGAAGAAASRSATASEHAGHVAAHQAPDAHADHGPGHAPTPAQAAAPVTSGAGPSYNVGHGPLRAAPPALPWALKKQAARSMPVGDKGGQTDGSRKALALQPLSKRPTGKASVPDVPKPDLRSLPAYGIVVTDGEKDIPGKDYLAFSANVWNAGPAQLVVDGFRSPGKAKMDAYQYFYDAKGKQVGYTPTGTMEWDPRPGHMHWHFTDFASYRLLKADQKEAVRSGKEAFCLANTDAIDYTVKNANWHPYNTDLSTACGEENSISVREVLDVGSGDTYSQDLPGQSFDITDVPNGTYYIQVLANPEKRLKETNLDNNSALRKIVLGGKPDARTVTVPAHDLVNAN
ncbi:protein-lysine 6-oxidase [Streptomyces sp. KPB2]|uniref:lysyl oxidase family protein n=1 Tax=unclassified Streptomyces TaxID=2593676 RepID=UPI000F717442|nr:MULTISPECIES: lysyl oxidase family protein [unclassified Streptomyces]AZM79621.1 protein-lysine 6-oxidase [Streptomyces sp. KPB2]MDU0251988.1 lysyl oxidase family protein [Streptomyces sp. PU10]QKW65251.1 protein-lysine 6-oxidase [Streptomyces sp. NA03103]